MTFTSTFFLFLFLPVAVAGYYLLPKKLKNAFLALISLLFYAAGDFQMFPLLLISLAVNYLLGLSMGWSRGRKNLSRGILLLLLLWNFGLLFYFKYWVFSLKTLNDVFGLSFVLPVIGLPMGISFYTFRTVSYGLDVYWETVPVQKNPLDYALYISFFPQITMGPITKYSHFSVQLKERRFDVDLVFGGVKRIITGLAQKLMIANSLGIIVDFIFSMGQADRTVVLSWLGVIGYLLQLYYDFAGYSNIAIGIGNLVGFKTPENFDYPYTAPSVVDFWNRWHISLGAWLKDYIYMPTFRALMGKKKISTFWRDIIALFAVWSFAGIWHGAAWKYVCYGYYNFLLIALERAWEYQQKQKRKRLKLKKQPKTKWQIAGSHFYLFVFLVFGQLLFRIDSLDGYLPYLKTMFSGPFTSALSGFLLRDSAITMLVGTVFCFPVIPWLKKKLETAPKAVNIAARIAEPAVYVVGLIVIVSFLLNSSYNPFLYLNF